MIVAPLAFGAEAVLRDGVVQFGLAAIGDEHTGALFNGSLRGREADAAFGADDDLVNQVKTFDTPTIRPLDAKAVADLNALGAQYVEFGFIKSTPDIANYVVDLSK